MPWSAPRGPRLLRSASRRSAIASASGFSSITLWSAGTTAIDRVDARDVLLGQRTRRVPAGLHPLLEVGDRRFLERELDRRRRLRAANGRDEQRRQKQLSTHGQMIRHADAASRFSTQKDTKEGPISPQPRVDTRSYLANVPVGDGL